MQGDYMSSEMAPSNAETESEQTEREIARSPRIQSINLISVIISVALVVAAFALIGNLLNATRHAEEINERYNNCSQATIQLMITSDYLTTQSRMYVLTGDSTYLNAYLEEFFVTKRRDAAVNVLEENGNNSKASSELKTALNESNQLAALELYAMKLTAEATDLSPMPVELGGILIKESDGELSSTEKRDLARNLVLGEDYAQMKDAISTNVDRCANELVRDLENEVLNSEYMTNKLLIALVVIALLLMGLVVFAAVSNYLLVTKLMRIQEKNLRNAEPLTLTGCREIKRVTMSYNDMFEKMRRRTVFLEHEAETDSLTGILNRGSYDRILESGQKDIALILADVDHFKSVNDQYGHTVGDEVLKRVSESIVKNFRSTDYVCRIGGDEFGIIATKVTPASKEVITKKLEAISAELASPVDDIPVITMSYGVAFSALKSKGNTLYHEADKAVYESKHKGRNAITFYEDMQ